MHSVIGHPIAIVVESVTDLSPRLRGLYARESPVVTLHGARRTDPRMTRITSSTAARTDNTCNLRHEIGEVVVSAGIEIFPRKVESVCDDRGIID